MRPVLQSAVKCLYSTAIVQLAITSQDLDTLNRINATPMGKYTLYIHLSKQVDGCVSSIEAQEMRQTGELQGMLVIGERS